MKKSVLNKQGNFGVKILWHYTDMAVFVLRCFILTHPVYLLITTNTATPSITHCRPYHHHHHHHYYFNIYVF